LKAAAPNTSIRNSASNPSGRTRTSGTSARTPRIASYGNENRSSTARVLVLSKAVPNRVETTSQSSRMSGSPCRSAPTMRS
jgi:hypothetical protein